MKLVRGRTLAALLARAGTRMTDRTRFLSVFEQVCQTMAYAHARGVIHRDLKPSNIMVGSFGEVQVMDWGLAKVLDQGGVADEEQAIPAGDDPATVCTLRAGRRRWSRGRARCSGRRRTWRPSRRAARSTRLDERADVFALGSILCEILTGQPAFAGGSVVRTLYRKAERAELSDALARLDASGADAELVALVRSRLAAAPKHRPRDAGTVVAGLTAYLRGSRDDFGRPSWPRRRAEARAVGERRRRLADARPGGVGARDRPDRRGRMGLDRSRAASARRGATLGGGCRPSRRPRRNASEPGPRASTWSPGSRRSRRPAAPSRSSEVATRAPSSGCGCGRSWPTWSASEPRPRPSRRTAASSSGLPRSPTTWASTTTRPRPTPNTPPRSAPMAFDLDQLDPTTAGRVLASSPAAADLASALDRWAFLRRGRILGDAAGADRLVAVARVADPDPWRNRLRDTLGRMEGGPTRRLDALERLAATANLDRLPAVSVTRLATSLAFLGEERAGD